jgi:cytochrome b6-f complex iron-sulfur subunit
LLNFLTGAAVAATAGSALYPIAQFFVPPREVTEGGGILAKDKLGNAIPASQILAEPIGTRALIAGLAGEPTYLTVNEDGLLSPEGLSITALTWAAPFPGTRMDQQFQCPCHGSLYDPDGSVVRGPAPLPLKIVHVAVKDDAIWIYPWNETDPRTGEQPWWV